MKQLDPILMQADFNKEMMMSVVSSENGLLLEGYFRSYGDMGGMMYKVVDDWSHEALRYQTQPDFTNVVLSYDYAQSGLLTELPYEYAPSLTVYTAVGIHFVRLYNYIVDRPIEPWEHGTGSRFPAGRSGGGAGFSTGRVVIDFNNLYAGYRPYEYYYLLMDKERGWWPREDWRRIDPATITKLLWVFPPAVRKTGSKYPLGGSHYFWANFSNWSVAGAKEIGGEQTLPVHPYKMADGYDDNYNVTPERLVKQYHALGFRGRINLYIGASHYYDKVPYQESGSFVPVAGQAEPEPVPGLARHELLDYEYQQLTDPPLNRCAEAWLAGFFEAAKAYGYQEVIGSLSMESVDCPMSWRQKDWQGVEAKSGWTPATKFVSFCHPQAKEYYQRYARKIADLQAAAGLPVVLQHGEPWWWSQAFITGPGSQGSPCFYDEATKQAFRQEKGRELPVYSSMWTEPYDMEAAAWLGEQIGKFTWLLRDHVRQTYPSAKMAVLFFPPTVLDPNRVGAMMRAANFPQSHWAYPQLDFFQVEDYDWVIDADPKHEAVFDFAQQELGYPAALTDYFAGFVLRHDPWTGIGLWTRIDQAAVRADQLGMPSFIWAGAQIRRDGWRPQRILAETLRPFPLSMITGGDVMGLCTLWVITRTDGQVFRYTDFDQNIQVSGLGEFKAEAGFTRTALTYSCEAGLDNVELSGAMSSEDITEMDILIGKYDHATVQLYATDPEDPDDKLTYLLKARLGEIDVAGGSFSTQIEGLSAALEQTYGLETTPECTRDLGDEKCGVDTRPGSGNVETGSVETVESATLFTITNLNITSDYSLGKLLWTSGANAGLGVEVQKVLNGPAGLEVHLCLPPPAAMAVGDSFSMVKGCDKSISTCSDKFGNVANFRGFPHLPGADKVLWRGGQ